MGCILIFVELCFEIENLDWLQGQCKKIYKKLNLFK